MLSICQLVISWIANFSNVASDIRCTKRVEFVYICVYSLLLLFKTYNNISPFRLKSKKNIENWKRRALM